MIPILHMRPGGTEAPRSREAADTPGTGAVVSAAATEIPEGTLEPPDAATRPAGAQGPSC